MGLRCATGFLKTGAERHLGMTLANTAVLVNLQTQPLAVAAPLVDGGGIEQRLLGGYGGGDKVAGLLQGIGAVTRAHQRFGIRRQAAALMVGRAAIRIGQARLAGAGGVGHGRRAETKTGHCSGKGRAVL